MQGLVRVVASHSEALRELDPKSSDYVIERDWYRILSLECGHEWAQKMNDPIPEKVLCPFPTANCGPDRNPNSGETV